MVSWFLESPGDEGWGNDRLHSVNTDHKVPAELALWYFPTLLSVQVRRIRSRPEKDHCRVYD